MIIIINPNLSNGERRQIFRKSAGVNYLFTAVQIDNIVILR
jgi:hypothetical protein